MYDPEQYIRFGKYQCPVVLRERLAKDIIRIRLQSPEIVRNARAGQFINIKVRDGWIPLLRRPFSIHRIDKEQGWFEILFKVVGQGTEILAHRNVKDTLDVVGPLGQGFQIDGKLEPGILIAGGIGVAPLLFLNQQLCLKGIKTLLFWGARTRDELCCLEDFKQLGTEVHVTTEDGSMGYKGMVTELVEEFLEKYRTHKAMSLFCCGPPAMLRYLAMVSEKQNIPCQLSLETMMACGLSLCMGCPVETKAESRKMGKYLLVCKDGPVFDARGIVLSD